MSNLDGFDQVETVGERLSAKQRELLLRLLAAETGQPAEGIGKAARKLGMSQKELQKVLEGGRALGEAGVALLRKHAALLRVIAEGFQELVVCVSAMLSGAEDSIAPGCCIEEEPLGAKKAVKSVMNLLQSVDTSQGLGEEQALVLLKMEWRALDRCARNRTGVGAEALVKSVGGGAYVELVQGLKADLEAIELTEPEEEVALQRETYYDKLFDDAQSVG